MKRDEDVGVGPRLDPRAAAWYRDNSATLNAGVTLALEAWPMLYQSALAEIRASSRLTAEELRLILRAFDGVWISPEIIGHHVGVDDSVRTCLLDAECGIDGRDLVRRLDALTRCQRAMLEVWAHAFWHGPRPGGRSNDPEFERSHCALLLAA